MTMRIDTQDVLDSARLGVDRLAHAARLLTAAVLMNGGGNHEDRFIDVEHQMVGEAYFFDIVVEHHDGFERIRVVRRP